MKRLPDASLLAARIVIGVTFLAYGTSLLEDTWLAERSFAGMGVPFPGLVLWIAAAAGIVGGLCFAAGFALPVVGVVLAVLSLVALIPADGPGAAYAQVYVPPHYILVMVFSCLGFGFNGGRFTAARHLSGRRGTSADSADMRG
ncbi:putative oxidoreductase [Murinocardiopsis flavida]|uniref:Putative oxidoreductase n=1 Tax=Murinocardiopsis flavida TaxID=645275 RepID=A0A2P8DMJ9_9ACTN|nr:DoxX family protein [Murinocardiopsis flavida]PSK98438.1 putative oxidoreductase [Murinocardiopsis flavida]